MFFFSRALPVALTFFALSGCQTDEAATRAPSAEAAETTPSTTERPENKTLAPLVEHYVGQTQASAPDGSVPYGPPQTSVAKRMLYPADGRIEEFVWYGGGLQKTVLQRDETGAFVGSDEDKTFIATIRYEGTAWQWTAWTYDIVLSGGKGRVTGSGTLEKGQMRTEKTFIGGDGIAKARVVETYSLIDEAGFKGAVAALEAAVPEAPPPGSKPVPPATNPPPQP